MKTAIEVVWGALLGVAILVFLFWIVAPYLSLKVGHCYRPDYAERWDGDQFDFLLLEQGSHSYRVKRQDMISEVSLRTSVQEIPCPAWATKEPLR